MISPSHAPPDAGLARGLARLASFDVTVDRYPTARRDTEWLRRHPEARAADVRRAFEDDGIDAVVAAMGGNACHELLSHLDEGVFRRNPKRFLAGSDNTHLHLLANAAGVVSFYGGQAFPDLAADAEPHP